MRSIDFGAPHGAAAGFPILMNGFSEPKLLERISTHASHWTGSSWAFLIAAGLTLLWFASGPYFGFSDTWQLLMNTLSSISTFIMVFLLQRSQIKESLSMQIKLNEIIKAVQGANNQLISIEDLSEEDILALRKRYQRLAAHIQRIEDQPAEPH